MSQPTNHQIGQMLPFKAAFSAFSSRRQEKSGRSKEKGAPNAWGQYSVAFIGGYIFAIAASTFLAHLLNALGFMPYVEAVVAALLVSFVFYGVAIIWAFAAPTVGRAALRILGSAAILMVANAAFSWFRGAP